MKVNMKNAATGENKDLNVGWSWSLFLFSGFFGIPLFMRKLTAWAVTMLMLSLIFAASNVMTSSIVSSGDLTDENIGLLLTLGTAKLVLSLVMGVLAIFLGLKGNKMTAVNLLGRGWSFSSPDSDSVRFAKLKWKLS